MTNVPLYTRETVHLIQYSAENTGFYLFRSVFAKQFGWFGNPVDYRSWRLMQECVHIVQDTNAIPATYCSASMSMTHGQTYHKTSKVLV